MKTSSRRRFGAAILAASLLGITVLFLLGVPLVSFGESHTHTFSNSSVSFSIMVLHLRFAILLTVGIVGLVLLFVSGHEKPNA